MSETADGGDSCGVGLSENSTLPGGMSRLLAALVRILETHVPTIDTGVEAGKREREAYVSLVDQFGRAAKVITAAAAEMDRYRDLPPAPHHEDRLADPMLKDVFEEYVRAEEALLAVLQDAAARDRAMLAFSRADSRSSS